MHVQSIMSGERKVQRSARTMARSCKTPEAARLQFAAHRVLHASIADIAGDAGQRVRTRGPMVASRVGVQEGAGTVHSSVWAVEEGGVDRAEN